MLPTLETIVSTLQTNVDRDQVKAAIKAQQDQQIDNVSIFILLCCMFLFINPLFVGFLTRFWFLSDTSY